MQNPENTIHERVAAQVRRAPERIVAVCGEEALTYREFESRSNRLAQFLVGKGVKPGDLVGVCIERSIDIPTVLMGILKSGAGYVPLDPDYPVDRLQYMCQDAGLKLVLGHESLSSLTETFGVTVVNVDSQQEKIATEDDKAPSVQIDDPGRHVAYVIYTSGSTGKPKGVQVQHSAVTNFLTSLTRSPGIMPDDIVLALTTLSFDISVLEVFGPMFVGATIAIVDRNTAKDGGLLIDAIERHEVSVVQATPSTWRFLLEAGWQGGEKFRCYSGGEPLPRDIIQPLLDRCSQLWNLYGPTETTVWSTICQITDAKAPILIGHAIDNTTLYIVGENNELVGTGEEGELLIGGDGVTLGYLNRPELTAEKFIDYNGERVYRTGDLAKFTAEGPVDCLGRIDSQIKLHGYRIELDEIDAVVASFPTVRRSATTVREDRPGDKRLVGYLVADDKEPIDKSALRQFALQQLPEYMVPSLFVVVDQIPQTPSGKLDRKALPKPSSERPASSTEFLPPKTEIELSLCSIFADVLGFDMVGVADNFFDLGGNSILALQVISQIESNLDQKITAPEFFDRPTVRSLIQHFEGADNASVVASQQKRLAPSCEIAIVGMGARFPGAANVQEFWQNLCNGVESIRFFRPEELDPSLPASETNDANYVAARGIVDDADKCDANFFGLTPREAQLTDPQQRVMLEVAWSALEDAGCIPARFSGRIGVWAGTYTTSYYNHNLLTDPKLVDMTGLFQLGVYNEKDYIATRVAHKLNLTGPAINVNTACSTSLVAVIMACNSLQLGQCDAAIAGASSVTFPQNSGHVYSEGSIHSPDGHCRPFDADAAGTLFSDGAGAVVLKRLDDAVRDGDHVYAVIKGTGLNNDGGAKASFSAPSIDGQSTAIAMAHAEADVPVDTIGYVECHGTATPIGDPIEIAGLRRVFESQSEKRQFCAIGSVKSNVGHTVAAAGVAGLIKAALSLRHEQIPATLHFQKPNPQIDFENSPFFVCDRLTPWSRTEQKRRAGVSSFGVGGTNAHVVIEEAPIPVADESSCENVPEDNSLPVQVFPVSAIDPVALGENLNSLAASITESSEETSISQLAWTLQHGRDQFPERAIVVAANTGAAAEHLTSKLPTECYRGRALPGGREVAFAFPGQGAQYVDMGRDLYEHSVAYRTAFDECLAALSPHMTQDLREIMFATDDAKASLLKQTEFTQPAMFAVSYSLGQMWIALGFQPKALIGHSIGEFAAACLAGVFSLEDAAAVIAHRGRLMGEVAPGTMLSVRLPGAEVEKRLAALEKPLSDEVVVASFNGPALCVVAGPTDLVEQVQRILEAEEVACRKLHTSHAFHSPMMQSIVAGFGERVSKCQLNKPSIPILSTVTGEWMTDEQATDPGYWASHLRLPVRFSQAISQLWTEHPSLALIELGPRKTLATLAAQHMTDRETQIAVASLADNAENHAEWHATMTAIGKLWVSGVDVCWRGLHPAIKPTKVSLPSYSYQRERFFIDPPRRSATPADAAPLHSDQPTLSIQSELPKMTTNTRVNQIRTRAIEVLEAVSGLDVASAGDDATFFALGMDSLVLTQAANAIKKEFGVGVTFRQLMESVPNLAAMVDYLDVEVPADAFVDETVEVAAPSQQVALQAVPATDAVANPANNTPAAMNAAALPQPMPTAMAPATMAPVSFDPNSPASSLMHQQLQIMQQQLQVLGGGAGQALPVVATPANSVSATPAQKSCAAEVPASTPAAKPCAKKCGSGKCTSVKSEGKKKVFGAGARVKLGSEELETKMQSALNDFIRDYTTRTPKSKAYAQQHRKYMADPRTVSGFRASLKEMTYPIVVTHSKGPLMWDLDGNEWLDVTCGFGSNFFGHTPDFIVDSISEQMKLGYEIGPQSPLAGEVARLFTEITGLERMCFSNTGSEAVLGATRLARSATAREKIVMFHNDYHGILDEVIVRGNKTGKSFPAATGIPPEHVANVMMLEYGSDESLRIIEENLDDLAAILVEPVQSRKPELQPKAFLQKLSAMTRNAETALIIDEVITGFRVAPGGAQQWFDIEADLATYGKVVGGGMPIGVIGGKAKYMDGLDGGFWSFGDDSQPEAGMTYFAGTFVRHPLTLAAAKATLEFIKREGQPVYDRLNGLTDDLAKGVNEVFERHGCPARFEHFGSLFKVQFAEDFKWGEMLFAALRHRGIHIWDHRPCLLTVSHTEEHVAQIVKAFDESVVETLQNGFLPCDNPEAAAALAATPPKDARKGKDRDGKPAWFVPDATNPGQFVQLNIPV